MKIPKQLKSKYAFHIQLIIWSVLLLCKTQIPSFSQTTTKRSEERVFTVVEKQPEFPGGENARKEFIAENLLTPKGFLSPLLLTQMVADKMLQFSKV
jgi:hypothetical protein